MLRVPGPALVVVGMLGAALLLGRPLKPLALEALEAGARVGLRLTGGAPVLQADSAQQGMSARLEAQRPSPAPSRTGGLLSPAYTGDGRVQLPQGYRRWVLVGSATGLAYGEPAVEATASHPGTFTLVYLEPEALQHWVETGTFREGTTFVLQMRRPTAGVSIARDGWFAGDSLGTHLAIKDTARYDTWAYFDVDPGGSAQRMPAARCSACHADNGAVDSVFVQFYPVLQEVREAYLSGSRTARPQS